MTKLFISIFVLFYLQYAFGSKPSEEYFSYVKQLSKSNGNYQDGEIEIILDPSKIQQIAEKQKGRLLKKGFSEEDATKFSRIGIIAEDHYWIWIRDAVLFPKGVSGTYNRVIWKNTLSSSPHGVAILPILPSGKIGLILTYRHATRSWEFELPRGGINLHEPITKAAMRELKEETGLVAKSLESLGEIALDTGMASTVNPIFIAKVSSKEDSAIEETEAIAGVYSFTKDEIKKGLSQGFLEVSVSGEKKAYSAS